MFLHFPQIFVGNQNHEIPELRSVGPLLTRFVRIYPERATAEGVGLRLELLGCELEGESLLPPRDILIWDDVFFNHIMSNKKRQVGL